MKGVPYFPNDTERNREKKEKVMRTKRIVLVQGTQPAELVHWSPRWKTDLNSRDTRGKLRMCAKTLILNSYASARKDRIRSLLNKEQE